MSGATTSTRPDLGLEATVRDLASMRGLWQPLVRFTEPRLKVRLDVGPDVEVWLLTWSPGQGTGLHDHGGSSGCFTVLQGNLWETVIDPDGAAHELRYQAGELRSFDSEFIHDVRNEGVIGAASLHVYRPELRSMTHYSAADGSIEVVRTQYAGIDW